MPDFRQSRDREYLTLPLLPYQNDPSYTPQDQIGGPGMGGAGNEAGIQQAHAELLDRLTGGLNRSEQLGQESRGLMDALQANHEAQRSQGSGLDLGGVWQGIKDAGSKGMDILGQGLSAITPSQEGYDNFAMRLQRAGAIANNQVPLYMREQQQQMEMANHQDVLASRRQQLAQHLEGIKEQKRGHDLQLLEKAIASPRAAALLEQLGQDPNYSMASQAAMLHKGLKDADYGSFQAYMEFIPEDVQKRFMDGKLPQHEMTAWLDEARIEAKESAKVNAKNAIITRAMNKPSDKRTPYEQQLVEEHQAKLEVEQMKPKKAQAEITEKESQAKMQLAHANLYDYQRETGGNSVQDMGNDREAAAQRLFKKRYVQLDQKQMKQADDAAAAFMGQAQGFKSTAVQQAQLAVPDKLSDTAREKTATDLSTLDLVDSMAKNYNREWVGPARGRGGAVMEKYSGMPGVPHIGEDEARFRSDITTLKNGVIKAITGAQMSEPEAERIMGQIPDANNPPEVFEARMKSTRANLKRMAERRREVLDKTGASTTDLPGVPKGEKKAKQGSGGGIPQITSPAEWEQLAPGTEYIDPNGKRKRKR